MNIIKKDERCRNWSFILYPESAPDNWKEILDTYHVKTIISPLHDLDVTKEGELKKAHHHVLVLFDGKKAYSQVYDMYSDKLCCTIPQKVISARGLVRYFCHLDNPEKAQYKTADIESMGGVDVKALLEPTDSDRYSLIQDIGAFISSNAVSEYCDLWEYALENNLTDWIPILSDYAYCINTLIRSRKYRNRT